MTEVHAPGAAAPEPGPISAVPSPTVDAAEGDGASPQDVAVLDSAMKEMSETISRLSSSLESVSSERQSFDEKIQRMEDRMRKLSSLTEMLSAQYNPFIGEAPGERAPLKADEMAAASLPSFPVGEAAPEPGPSPAPEPAVEPGPSAGAEPELHDEIPVAEGTFVPDAPEVEPGPSMPLQDESEESMESLPEHEVSIPHHAPPAGTPTLEHANAGFQSHMLLLNWSNMLLDAARSREGLRQIVDYYHSLGWIGDGVRDTLVAYAEGLRVAEGDGPASDWRGDVTLHERSLLFIEKLRGGAP